MPTLHGLQIQSALAHGSGQWATDLVCDSQSAAGSKVRSPSVPKARSSRGMCFQAA